MTPLQGGVVGTLTGLAPATSLVRTGQPGPYGGAQHFDAVCLHGCCSLSVLLNFY